MMRSIGLVVGLWLCGCGTSSNKIFLDTNTQCNSVTLPSAMLLPIHAMTTAPTPAGGTIAPGTYTLGGWTIFGAGTTGATSMAWAWLVTATTYEYVRRTVDSSGSDTTTVENGEYFITGGAFTTTSTCPGNPRIGDAFSIDTTATSFTLYDTIAGTTQALRFTSQ
jgi:hypothetical protein